MSGIHLFQTVAQILSLLIFDIDLPARRCSTVWWFSGAETGVLSEDGSGRDFGQDCDQECPWIWDHLNHSTMMRIGSGLLRVLVVA